MRVLTILAALTALLAVPVQAHGGRPVGDGDHHRLFFPTHATVYPGPRQRFTIAVAPNIAPYSQARDQAVARAEAYCRTERGRSGALIYDAEQHGEKDLLDSFIFRGRCRR